MGVDPDPGMLTEATREADRSGVTNARWTRLRAEELPGDLGTFRVATFSRSFHWMEREAVAATMLRMLEAGGRGAFVQVTETADGVPEHDPATMPHPAPPREAIRELVQRYLGAGRRAGQGIRNENPDGETNVLEGGGFQPPQIVRVTGREIIERSVEDVVASVLSQSRAAPHLFGARLPEFESDLRELLAASTATGAFAERTGDTELRIWRTPASG